MANFQLSPICVREDLDAEALRPAGNGLAPEMLRGWASHGKGSNLAVE